MSFAGTGAEHCRISVAFHDCRLRLKLSLWKDIWRS
jgi:hypothetical protein